MKTSIARTIEEEVVISARNVDLQGNLTLPENAQGIILFAHGSGSSRHSVRNRFVASYLNRDGFGTLLMDLLSAEEESFDLATAHLRFDIGLLAERLMVAVDWLQANEATQKMRIGLFGSSTGGGAALVTAAREPGAIGAVVSRGGRPDMAGTALPEVKAPTLLIIGGDDLPVIELNREAAEELRCPKAIKIIPGATHLFEEPGTLEEVARLASEWFAKHL